MTSTHVNAARRVTGLLAAIALACSLCPAAALADSEGLAAAPVPVEQGTTDRQVTSQAAGVQSAKKTTKKSAAFTITKYKKVKKFAYAKGKWAYGKPTLKGSSSAVKKINKSLNKRYKAFRKTADSVIEYAKEATSGYSGAVFHNTYSTKATYNEKGYISFRYYMDWFAGGVHNSSYYGDVYSLKSGKKLNITQVTPGNAYQVKRKIAEAVSRKYSGLDIYDGIASKKVSTIGFYLTKGKVVAVIEPYTVPGQRNAFTVTLKGNYA